jgi:2-polyprenyl-6-methoxyphenol hydroxylase-like FAD-dependent oxidoreductase
MTKALIIGGGIAGPVTAIALCKAGVDSVIYEAYPAGTGDAGAFLTIAANGQDALRAIDAEQPVRDASFPATRLQLFNSTGTQLADVPLGSDHDCPRTLTRAALGRVLCEEAARRGIRIEHGKRLVCASTPAGGTVFASFADGSHAEADLLIGADGIHSPVRTLIDPAAPAPRYVGLTIACGYAENTPVTGEPDTYRMSYGSRGFFGCTGTPDGQTWWFARVPAPELTAADRAAPASHWRQQLADVFAADNTPAAEIVRATRKDITITSAYDIASLPAWHNGPMIVIGDAAHAASPSTAQGASMAIEDGVILAQCLRDIPDIPNALTAYEQLRRDRVERVVKAGASSDKPSIPGPGPRQGSSADWLYKHHIDWDTPLSWQPAPHAGHQPS